MRECHAFSTVSIIDTLVFLVSSNEFMLELSVKENSQILYYGMIG